MGPTLVELRVRNLGVIDDVTIALRPGMTALTGETGAGKTLVVEALSLLLGGRADPSMVRAGAEEAMVEGRFSMAPADPGEASDPDRDDLLLARSVARAGRSKAWIDGRMATVGTLAESAGGLIELHGQHQHQSLVHVEAQRRALDTFGHIDLSGLERARDRLEALHDELTALGGDASERAREVDLLRYQIDEIDAARIEDADEDRRLEIEEDRLAASSAHRQAAAAALAAVSGSDDASALDRLAEASQALSGRAPLEDVESRLRSVMAELADVATELRTVVETWDDDPQRLDEVRTRRQLFHQLVRKYGDTLGEVLEFAEGARERMASIAGEEQRAAVLDDQIRAAREDVDEAEAEVASLRRRWAGHALGPILHHRRRSGVRRPGDVPAGRQPRRTAPAADQGGVGGRAGPHHAGSPPGHHRRPRRDGVRRGRRGGRRGGRHRGGSGAGRARRPCPGARRHPPRPGGGPG